MNAPTEPEIRESFRRDFNRDGTPRDLAALLDNAQAQINQLRDWLAAHPHPSTADGRQARKDRELALARWLKLAQQESKP